jgi:hypothetical protein
VNETKVVIGQFHRVQRGRGKGFASEPPPDLVRHPARVAVMLALAHQIQRALRPVARAGPWLEQRAILAATRQ